MTNTQKQQILDAWDWCDDEDKSTEFMLQYMSDVSGLSYGAVTSYIGSNKSNMDRHDYYMRRNEPEIAMIFKKHFNKK